MINLEAEKSLIGSIILKNELYQIALNKNINKNCFTDTANKIIFSSFKNLEKIDPVIIENKIDEKYHDYLFDIIESVPSTANFETYCDIVYTNYKKRFFNKTISKSLNDIEGNLLEDVINDTIKKLEKINNFDTKVIKKNMGEIYDEMFEEFENESKMPDSFCLGFDTFSKDLHLEGGDLVLIGGRPGSGKTAYAINIAERLSKQMKIGIFFSLEMTSRVLGRRMLSSMTQVKFSKIKNKYGYKSLTEEEYEKLGKKYKEFKEMPLSIIDKGGLFIDDIVNLSKEHKRLHGLDYIIIDYAQLIRVKGKKSRYEEITEVSLSLKALAMNLNIPVIALAQLSRIVETRQDKRPVLSDLKDSGQLEQDASIIQFLYRESYYDENTSNKITREDGEVMDVVEISNKKNRNGKVNIEYLAFHGDTQRFFELDFKK
jgi:replicative DNA helicase